MARHSSAARRWSSSSPTRGGCARKRRLPRRVRSSRLPWRPSPRSHSGAEGGECVEVAATWATVHVRDSKDTAREALSVAPAA
ncbi:DUF397 domain-containing protein [Streptomyces radiopugnans]|uniref:DUF397 domain-containing protein n=1 Tax=Streptomyces radiopugnans TaxID=403935 RepID=UPI003F1A10F3